ncbi:hypothetical protein PHYSODRAFT_361894 [Phytophthora sojae]|uniref:Uncharacterized protein n=1 Tax=Phytophthora sojae (strain P6497) TaxID=1094619 RepID=G5A2T0_PHYSP|nr:hypothetical protein PHYSODRAFT_361894 [Phytophthora sojae]EGZ09970.1 hypothetical protein PHYSODRAFT_361894 [Phytophthora sojae]|eukprot:XP_009534831.1 hypothetical protein PHYSODRAFT_361894 [Phytophthora sojae]
MQMVNLKEYLTVFVILLVDNALQESKAKETEHFFEIDDEWVDEQEKRISDAMASEGLAEEELAAVPVFVDGEGGAFVAAELKENAQKRAKARYEEKKEAGLCISCKAKLPADSGLFRCTGCRRKDEVKYHLRQEYGLCTQCGKEKPPGETRSACAECCSKFNAQTEEKRRLRAPGKCSMCCTRNCAVRPVTAQATRACTPAATSAVPHSSSQAKSGHQARSPRDQATEAAEETRPVQQLQQSLRSKEERQVVQPMQLVPRHRGQEPSPTRSQARSERPPSLPPGEACARRVLQMPQPHREEGGRRILQLLQDVPCLRMQGLPRFLPEAEEHEAWRGRGGRFYILSTLWRV